MGHGVTVLKGQKIPSISGVKFLNILDFYTRKKCLKEYALLINVFHSSLSFQGNIKLMTWWLFFYK